MKIEATNRLEIHSAKANEADIEAAADLINEIDSDLKDALADIQAMIDEMEPMDSNYFGDIEPKVAKAALTKLKMLKTNANDLMQLAKKTATAHKKTVDKMFVGM